MKEVTSSSSMAKTAALIMQKVWYNKELGVSLTPKEYNSSDHLVIFQATPSLSDSKSFRYTAHVRDLQVRIDNGTLVFQTLAS